MPCSSSMTGSWGWLRANHAGGTHTYACRGVNFRFCPGMGTLRVAPWSGSWPVLATCVAHGVELRIVEEVVGALAEQAVEGRVVRERLVHGAARRHQGQDHRDHAADAAGPVGPPPSGHDQAGHEARHAQPYVQGPGRAGGDRLGEVKPHEQEDGEDDADRDTDRELPQHVPAEHHRCHAGRDGDPEQDDREPAGDDRDVAGRSRRARATATAATATAAPTARTQRGGRNPGRRRWPDGPAAFWLVPGWLMSSWFVLSVWMLMADVFLGSASGVDGPTVGQAAAAVPRQTP